MCADRISRRRLLATIGLIGVAGCSGKPDSGGATSTDSTRTKTSPSSTTPGTESTSTNSQSEQTATQFESFVTSEGRSLSVDNHPMYLFGTRPHFVMNLNSPEKVVSRMFEVMAQNNHTLARVHAFQPSWGDESKQPQPGEISEAAMQRLDRVIQQARLHGIRLSLILINGKPPFHIAESMDDNYGVNVHTYANYVESAETFDDFYSNQECIRLVKQRVKKVLTRTNTITGTKYLNEPAIMMWELGNEIEYEKPWQYDDPSLRDWIDEVGGHVKSVDQNHLVTTGEFGWADRNNYVDDHQSEAVDLCSIHYYPGPKGYDLQNNPDRDHPGLLKDLIQTGHQEISKPVYVGEYNWMVEKGAEPPLKERNEQLRKIHEVLNETDVSAAAYHMLSLDELHTWPRGPAKTFARKDEGTMEEIRRFAGVQADKSG